MPADAPTLHWPPEVTQRLARAQSAHQAGDFARAEAAYRELQQCGSGLPAAVAAACNGLGLIRHAQGQDQAALAELERAVALDPHAPSHHGNLALVLHALQRFDAAEAACRAAIQRRPAYPEAWNNLGNSYFARRQHAMARARYREALRHRRTYVNAWMNLARTELALEQPEAARRVLHRVLRLAPSARAWHLLAQAENQGRAYAAALAAVEQGQAGDPTGAIDWLPLHANLLSQNSRPEEACVLQQQRCATQPQDPEAWNDLGLTLDALNRLPEALEAFDRALVALQHDSGRQAGTCAPAPWLAGCRAAAGRRRPAAGGRLLQPADGSAVAFWAEVVARMDVALGDIARCRRS